MLRFLEKSSTQIALVILNTVVYATSTGALQHFAVFAIGCGFFCLGFNHGGKMKEIDIEKAFKSDD